jgi:16S rRNA C967 or C1407 C5-methylase (RsmB/RsmF family)
LFDAENDDVVGRFLKENPSFLPAIISSKIPYDKRKYGFQYLPDISYGAGFYVSALRRVG